MLARSGHERAFVAIVERYRRPLHAFARRMVGDGRVEDVLQQAFVSAWTALNAGAEVRHLRGWLHQIVRNAAIAAAHGPGEDELSDTLIGAAGPEGVVERPPAMTPVSTSRARPAAPAPAPVAATSVAPTPPPTPAVRTAPAPRPQPVVRREHHDVEERDGPRRDERTETAPPAVTEDDQTTATKASDDGGGGDRRGGGDDSSDGGVPTTTDGGDDGADGGGDGGR